jgi:hypothetical protein
MSQVSMQAKEIPGGEVLISVPIESSGFRGFLKKSGYDVSELGEENIKIRSWNRDESGKPYSDDFWIGQDFKTNAPFDKIPELFDSWIQCQN